MADSSRIAQLILDKVRDTLSEEDKAELEAWINESSQNKEFMDSRVRPEVIIEQFEILSEMDEESLDNRVFALLNASIRRKNRRKIIRIGATIAAASILVLLILFTWIKPKAPKKPSAPFVLDRSAPFIQNQLLATSQLVDRPQIQLADNSILYLDSLHQDIPYPLEHYNIVKIGDHQLAYFRSDTTKATQNGDSLFNMISIPEGSPGWQVFLPDGSTADLKVGSALSYLFYSTAAPLRQRLWVLNGAATFNIAHNNNGSLIVETQKAEMQDKGTVFSISDYKKEDNFNVLVHQGSVTVNSGTEKQKLDSAERASIQGSSSHIAITRGVPLPPTEKEQQPMFDFSHQNVLSAIRKLAGWYGRYRIIYESDIDTVTPGLLGKGHIAKDFSATLPDLLQAMETPEIHFHIQQHDIYINR